MSKYTLPHYTPMIEIGETQQEIDLVNNECKNIYLGVWQGALSLCYDLYEYQVQNDIDTTFILDKEQEVWKAIYQATEDKLLDDTDIEILSPYKLEFHEMMVRYSQDTPINEPRTKTITKTHSAETDTEDVTIVTTTTVIKTPKKKEEVVPYKSLRDEIMRYNNNKTKENE